MAKVNYTGTVINDSPTFVGPAGAAIKGPFLLVAFQSGKLVPATSSLVPFGVTIAETPEDVAAGDDVHVQIKEQTVCIAGAEFSAGDLLAADDTGKVVKATAKKFIFGVALEAGEADAPVRVQITKSGYAV